MKSPMLFAALIAGAALLPQVASAQDNVMKPPTGANTSTALWCRAVKPGEKATMQMVGVKTLMVCNPVDLTSGPDMSNMTSAKEANAAWRAWVLGGMQPDRARANAKHAVDEAK